MKLPSKDITIYSFIIIFWALLGTLFLIKDKLIPGVITLVICGILIFLGVLHQIFRKPVYNIRNDPNILSEEISEIFVSAVTSESSQISESSEISESSDEIKNRESKE